MGRDTPRRRCKKRILAEGASELNLPVDPKDISVVADGDASACAPASPCRSSSPATPTTGSSTSRSTDRSSSSSGAPAPASGSAVGERRDGGSRRSAGSAFQPTPGRRSAGDGGEVDRPGRAADHEQVGAGRRRGRRRDASWSPTLALPAGRMPGVDEAERPRQALAQRRRASRGEQTTPAQPASRARRAQASARSAACPGRPSRRELAGVELGEHGHGEQLQAGAAVRGGVAAASIIAGPPPAWTVRKSDAEIARRARPRRRPCSGCRGA